MYGVLHTYSCLLYQYYRPRLNNIKVDATLNISLCNSNIDLSSKLITTTYLNETVKHVHIVHTVYIFLISLSEIKPGNKWLILFQSNATRCRHIWIQVQIVDMVESRYTLNYKYYVRYFSCIFDDPNNLRLEHLDRIIKVDRFFLLFHKM